uniref:Uncharacterized protein n=1 Tax=Anguilla anguilla TaxID=7936 RepID=A0A0E9XSX8_ANGAN
MYLPLIGEPCVLAPSRLSKTKVREILRRIPMSHVELST